MSSVYCRTAEMTRRPYGNIELYRSANQSHSMNPSRPRESARAFPIGQRIGRVSPPIESDSEKSGNRRRIAVACSRCRKRKIKCSGEKTPGESCQNCKNANTGPGECQFLRVNSMGDMAFNSQEWLYTANTIRTSTGSGQHVHPLAPFSSNVLGLVSSSAPASYSGVTQLPRVHSHSGTSYGPSYARHDHSPNYGLGLSEYNYEHQLNYSPSQYLPQGSDAQAPNSIYAGAESSRFGLGLGMPASNYDFDVSGRYSVSSNNSYINTSTMPAPTTRDNSSVFPTMHSLTNSLSSSFPGHRVLPIPATASGTSNAEESGSVNQGVFDDIPPFAPLQKGNTKRVTMDSETEADSGIHGSTGIETAESEALTSTASSKSSSSTTSSDNQESTYGYAPLSQSPPSHDTIPAASEYSLTSQRSSGIALETQGYASKSSYSNDLPNEILAMSSLSPSTTYTHSSIPSSKYGSFSSQLDGGVLLSGQPYTQLRHLSSHASHSFESALEPVRRPLYQKNPADNDWISTRSSMNSRR